MNRIIYTISLRRDESFYLGTYVLNAALVDSLSNLAASRLVKSVEFD
jgi:hypothetical protein